MHKVSDKQARINRAKMDLHRELAAEREHFCTGCGSTSALTHSHIIPVSRRKDLELEKDNITYHCLDCHTIWEHGTLQEKQKLHDYVDRMLYIGDIDHEYFCLIKQ